MCKCCEEIKCFENLIVSRKDRKTHKTHMNEITLLTVIDNASNHKNGAVTEKRKTRFSLEEVDYIPVKVILTKWYSWYELYKWQCFYLGWD